MSMPGMSEPSTAVIVYGPDGTMYGSPAAARAAGVTNYTMQPPAGVPVTPISPRDSSVPFNPSSEEQRLNFNQFADAYNAYQNPNLAPVAPAFGGYGYQAPTMDMMLAPQQMPQMMLDPNAIYDPTVGAAMQILNNPMMIRQTPGLLGAGTDYQRQFGLLRDIAPTRMQQYERIAAPPPPPPSLIRDVGGGSGADGRDDRDNQDRGGGYIERSNIGIPSTQFRDSIYDYGNEIEMSNKGIPSTQFRDSIYDYGNEVEISNLGIPSTQFQDSVYDYGNEVEMSNQGVPGTQFQDSAYDYGDSGNSGGGKIVCTAMNEAYGFGSFRNRIWLAYSAKHLTKAHEAGYHAMFLPLVAAGYKQDKWYSKPLRAVLENIARHRSADLRAEMRGGKRDRVGQAYRFILEPLCYAVGKLKGK